MIFATRDGSIELGDDGDIVAADGDGLRWMVELEVGADIWVTPEGPSVRAKIDPSDPVGTGVAMVLISQDREWRISPPELDEVVAARLAELRYRPPGTE